MDAQWDSSYAASGSARQVAFHKISKKVVGYNMTTFILSKLFLNRQQSVPDYPEQLFRSLLSIPVGAQPVYTSFYQANNSLVSAEGLIYLQAPYLEALYLGKTALSQTKTWLAT